MVDLTNADPNQAKGIGDLIGWASNSITGEINKMTGWITSFISGLTWFEWCIIVFIIAMLLVYIVLNRKVEFLKNKRMNSLNRRRRFK